MRFPLPLTLSMAKYLIGKRIRGIEKYPLVLMLEPTHRCNLNCAGCGRIIEYHDTINQEMTLEECLEAVDVTETPVVTITGGEPLLYAPIGELVSKVLDRGRNIFFCTNGQLLEASLDKFRPSQRFTWNLHFDATEELHDQIISRPGGFRKALSALKAAKKKGFRVTTNTTVYGESDLSQLEELFTQLTEAGVDGILVAPGFEYGEVTKDIFMDRDEIHRKFRIVRSWRKRFPFISNPLYLEFLTGERSLQCTPWGNPTRNPRGWKSPCYLITDEHYPTFAEMMEKTDWDYYLSGKDPRCAQCMMHCGYEPTVVRQLGLGDLFRMIRWNLDD